MTTQAAVSVWDGKATPVSHTFDPVGVDQKGVARWLEKTTNTLVAGAYQWTTSVKISPKPGEPVRCQMKLVVPTVVTETLNGVDYQKVIRQMLATVDVIVPGDSTLIERTDMIAYLVNLISISESGVQGFGYQIANINPVI